MPAKILLVFLLFISTLQAQETIVVENKSIENLKSVFATVESVNVVSARARINGTLADLSVDEGDFVEIGQVIAKVGDEKLALQIGSMDARIAVLRSQMDKANTDLNRAKELLSTGTVAQARVDDVQTQFNIAKNALDAGISDRAVIRRQVSEGDVLAPVSGRVLNVPLTRGTVVMPGEMIATIAEGNYVLRLALPERHARNMKKGDPVRLDSELSGEILNVYPQIKDGRIIADAIVDGLGDYFVGERVRVWISSGTREVILLPKDYIVTRFGIDYATLQKNDGQTIEVPIQLGLSHSTRGGKSAIEVLSGLYQGDKLVKP